MNTTKTFFLDYVYPRVIADNAMNRAMVKDNEYIYTEVADLIVYYSFDTDSTDKESMVSITNAMVKAAKSSISEIDAAAKKNIRDKVSIKTLEGCVLDILGKKGQAVEFSAKDSSETLVVSTSSNLFGAGIIITDLLAEFAEDKYYIIPSSRHEIMLISKDKISKNELKDVVVDINSTFVDASDKLSDSIYAIKDGKLVVAA